MTKYNISLLGVEVSFKTDADDVRVSQAKNLLEQRFQSLDQRGRSVNKEKLLTLLALSLADDYLETSERLKHVEGKIDQILQQMETVEK